MLGAGGEGPAEGETEDGASAGRPGPAEAAVGTLHGEELPSPPGQAWGGGTRRPRFDRKV